MMTLSTLNSKYPPWRLAILVTFWFLQLAFMLSLAILLAVVWSVFKQYDRHAAYDPNADAGLNEYELKAKKVYTPAWIAMCVFAIILTICEIRMVTRHLMTPVRFIIFNGFKTVLFSALLIFDIVQWGSDIITATTVKAVGIEIPLALACFIPLADGIVVYRESRLPVPEPSPSHPSRVQHRRDVEASAGDAPPPAYMPGSIGMTEADTLPPYKKTFLNLPFQRDRAERALVR